MDELQLKKREIVVNRILSTIEEYCNAFQKPIPLKILSAKYARTTMEFGGLPELIEDLNVKKQLQVYLTENGAKLVLPANAKKAWIPENGVKL